MTNIARYTNGHLFNLYETERTQLVEQIAIKLGGMDQTDFANFDKFAERVKYLSELASSKNCRLYVDAE